MVALASAGQEQRPMPPPVQVPGATVEVVQVDAVVTDSRGEYVTDLTAADFEIREDGREQTITNCSYVASEATVEPVTLAPLQHLAKRQAVHRTMALVVDDLGLSFESVARVRTALHDFVDHQMQPGDLVAVVRTSAGLGALQQFTSDRRMLHAAVDAIRFTLASRGTVAAFSMPGLHGGGESGGMSGGGQGGGAGAAAIAAVQGRMGTFEAARERDRQLYLASGSLGALRFVLGGLLRMPGRKSIVLVSEGFPQYDETGSRSRIADALGDLVELANRASVVVYSFDPSGLKAVRDIKVETEMRTGLNTLAIDTGGFLVADSNDLGGLVERVLVDQRGYYLIGYTPDERSSRGRPAQDVYHRVTVRVRRPGLKVRSRRGFFSASAGGEETETNDPVEKLLEAAQSPFSASDLGLRLTTMFEHEEGHSFVRSILHLDAGGLTFVERPDGSREAAIQLVTLAYGADGRAVKSAGRQDRLGLEEDAYQATLRGGLVYSFEMPVDRPGGYQVRAAVLDTASGRVGSASQFVEVPKVEGRLVLSGIAVSGDADEQAADPDTTAAVRRFPPGAMVTYACFAYNAGSGLEVRPTVYRDTTAVYEPAAMPLDPTGQRDPHRLAVMGRLHLPAGLEPGAYSLEVAVRETGGKRRAARQWIEFEIAAP
jgi:VWFA-related protein